MLWNETIRQCILQRLSGYRYEHTLGVERAAIHLAQVYDCDVDKCAMSACLHDITKNLSRQEQLYLCEKYDIIPTDIEIIEWKMLHGKTAAAIAKQEYRAPQDVVEAVACHTAGRKNMTQMDKVLYLADYIEETRDFDGVQIARELATHDLDQALLYCFDRSLVELVERGKLIGANTIAARNDLIAQGVQHTRWLRNGG